MEFTASPLPALLSTLTKDAPNVPVPSNLSSPAALFTTIPEAFDGKAIVPAPASVNSLFSVLISPVEKVRVLSAATSIEIFPDWVSAPERVSVSSASRVPPFIETAEASVPVSPSFIDPPVTVIPPDKVFPDAIDTGVV